MGQRAVIQFDICPNLHAMSDFGFAHDNSGGRTYSRPTTNNAECYADKCHRKGKCLTARFTNFIEEDR